MTNYTVQKLIDIYRSDKTPSMIYKLEEKGLIPAGQRVKRGVINTRMWPSSDLPLIGSKIGFLDAEKISDCKILVFYFPKGGVGKTTNAINFARTFAINGIKTLYIETDKTNSGSSVLRMSDDTQKIGLYDVMFGDKTLKDIICNTELSTLDFIPATSNIIDFEYRIQTVTLPQFVFNELLKPLKNEYKIIIIDDPSNFGLIVQNTLSFCTHLVAPLQCESICFQSLIDNIKTIKKYKSDISRVCSTWNTIYLRTMLGDDNDSKAICDSYGEILGDEVCPYPTRRYVTASSAYLDRKSVIEYKPKSDLANDYYKVICDVYRRITNGNKI